MRQAAVMNHRRGHGAFRLIHRVNFDGKVSSNFMTHAACKFLQEFVQGEHKVLVEMFNALGGKKWKRKARWLQKQQCCFESLNFSLQKLAKKSATCSKRRRDTRTCSS